MEEKQAEGIGEENRSIKGVLRCKCKEKRGRLLFYDSHYVKLFYFHFPDFVALLKLIKSHIFNYVSRNIIEDTHECFLILCLLTIYLDEDIHIAKPSSHDPLKQSTNLK